MGSACAPPTAAPRQRGGLADPVSELVAEIRLAVDLEVARCALPGIDRRQGREALAVVPADLHVLVVAVEREEPAGLLRAVERRVPLYRLADARHLAADDRVDPPTRRMLPPAGACRRHCIEERRDGGLAESHRDLRVVAGEEDGFGSHRISLPICDRGTNRSARPPTTRPQPAR